MKDEKVGLKALIESTLTEMLEFINSFFITFWCCLVKPHKISDLHGKSSLLMSPLSFLLISSFVFATQMNTGFDGVEEAIESQKQYINESFSLVTVLLACFPLFLATTVLAIIGSKAMRVADAYHSILLYSAVILLILSIAFTAESYDLDKMVMNAILLVLFCWLLLAVAVHVKSSKILDGQILNKIVLFPIIFSVPIGAVSFQAYTSSLSDSRDYKLTTVRSESFVDRNANYELKFVLENNSSERYAFYSDFSITLYHVPETYAKEDSIKSVIKNIDTFDRKSFLPITVEIDGAKGAWHVLDSDGYLTVHVSGSTLGWHEYFVENQASNIKGKILYSVQFRGINEDSYLKVMGSLIDIH